MTGTVWLTCTVTGRSAPSPMQGTREQFEEAMRLNPDQPLQCPVCGQLHMLRDMEPRLLEAPETGTHGD